MIEETKTQLDCYWETYVYQVRTLAKQIFEVEVKPFCLERGYEFKTTITGEWHIGEPGCDAAEAALWSYSQPPDESELRPLHDLLNIRVSGFSVLLGTLMPDFKPHDSADLQQSDGSA